MRMLEMLSEPVMGVMDRREAGLPSFLRAPLVYLPHIREWWTAAATASPVDHWSTADLMLLRELVTLRAMLAEASGFVVGWGGRAVMLDPRYLPVHRAYVGLLRVMALRPIDRTREARPPLRNQCAPECLSPPGSYYG
jgi:hypothetical protein